MKKCFAGERATNFVRFKEPVRTHVAEILRWFLSQPSGLKGALAELAGGTQRGDAMAAEQGQPQPGGEKSPGVVTG